MDIYLQFSSPSAAETDQSAHTEEGHIRVQVFLFVEARSPLGSPAFQVERGRCRPLNGIPQEMCAHVLFVQMSPCLFQLKPLP